VRAISLSREVEAEPPALMQGSTDIPEQTPVVLDPVKRGVGKHNIELVGEVQLIDVHQEKPQVLPGFRLGRFNHPVRGVDTDNLPIWNEIGKLRGDRPIAAPKV
jgi:hypothetical protein